MECSLPDCGSTADLKCAKCGELYCSKAHQHQDWYSGRHVVRCASRKIQASLQEVRVLYNLGNQQQLTQQRLVGKFRLTYVANGTYGIVFTAKTKGSAQYARTFALKAMFDDFDYLEHEARVAMMLSKLYVDNGDAFDTLSPIVTTYDYGKTTWTKDDITNFLLPFESHAERLERILTRLDDPQQVGFLLMELVAGKSLSHFLAEKSQPDAFFSVLPDLLLQALLMLNDMQQMVEFVHYDLHTGNFLVQELASPVVLSYTLASDMSFYIKTKYVLRMVDFGRARMKWDNKVYHAGASGYKVASTGTPALPSFRPWADTMLLALKICAALTSEQYAALPDHPRVVALLTNMTLISTISNENTQALRTVTSMLRRLTSTRKIPDAADAEAFSDAAQAASRFVYDVVPAASAVKPTPDKMVRDSVSLFWKHQQYVAAKDDQLYDMNMQIGHKSASTRPGATMPEADASSGFFTWMNNLVK